MFSPYLHRFHGNKRYLLVQNKNLTSNGLRRKTIAISTFLCRKQTRKKRWKDNIPSPVSTSSSEPGTRNILNRISSQLLFSAWQNRECLFVEKPCERRITHNDEYNRCAFSIPLGVAVCSVELGSCILRWFQYNLSPFIEDFFMHQRFCSLLYPDLRSEKRIFERNCEMLAKIEYISMEHEPKRMRTWTSPKQLSELAQ